MGKGIDQSLFYFYFFFLRRFVASRYLAKNVFKFCGNFLLLNFFSSKEINIESICSEQHRIWNHSECKHFLRNVSNICNNWIITFGYIFIFYQGFLTPLRKQSVIISNRHGIYELLRKFTVDFGLRI